MRLLYRPVLKLKMSQLATFLPKVDFPRGLLISLGKTVSKMGDCIARVLQPWLYSIHSAILSVATTSVVSITVGLAKYFDEVSIASTYFQAFRNASSLSGPSL